MLSLLPYFSSNMWKFFVGAFCFLTVLGSFPGNFTIVHYLNEKPLGQQTTLDIVIKDFFTVNFLSGTINGLRYGSDKADNILVNLIQNIFFSITRTCYFGKLNDITALILSWVSQYFNLLLFTSGVLACFYRYCFVFKANELFDLDDW